MADTFDEAGNKRFLTKEEELALGVVIQEHYRAKELLSSESISPEQKAELEAKIADGVEAVDTMVRANIKLVYRQANNFRTRYPNGPQYEDLVQDGMIGLMTAVAKYDPDRGNKFSTVAYHWINQSMARNTNNTFRLVRLPENRVTDLFRTLAIAHSDEAKGLDPEEVDNLIMDKLNLTPQTLANIRAAGSMPVSLNRPVGSKEDGAQQELIDVIAQNRLTDTMESDYLRTEASDTLRKALMKLDEATRMVVISSFGILPDQDITPNKVRKKFGLSGVAFKSVLNDGIASLRSELEKHDMNIQDFA